MDYQAGDLRIVGNNYYVQNKRDFQGFGNVSLEDKLECFEFAYNMTYAQKGAHRDSRSGGEIHRTMGQIFINTFQGKLAEFALYRYLEECYIDVEKPDLEEYELGKWDAFDLDCQGKHFSVKSTKSYGDLLLLETKDWNENGEYIPNISVGTSKYDYTVLVRFKPDGESLMKKHSLLYQKEKEIPANIKEILEEIICKQNWTYDFPGFIYHSELVGMIHERRIIPKNAMLNGNTQMDAENFYFQTGNMHAMLELFAQSGNGSAVVEDDLLLKRKCPYCGRKLVVRQGYSRFWGCEGYFASPSCRYTEPMKER